MCTKAQLPINNSNSMKIIHTYWSKPSIGTNDNLLENRFDGGWFSAKYHFMSWALSCLKARQFYDNVELYTDMKGKEILIDKLCLPYTKVHTCLNDLDYVPKQMWALSKIYTYGLQNEPFIHIDGDVYIWEKFNAELENTALVAQNMEKYNSYYRMPLKHIMQRKFNIPSILENIDLSSDSDTICAANAGILGGNDISFFKEYSTLAFEFLNNNLRKFNHKDAGRLNVVIEQLFFYRMAKEQNKEIKYLLDDVKEDFSNLMRFVDLPHRSKYIHLVGFAKQILYACNMVERHLQYEFPDYYSFFIKSFISESARKTIRITKEIKLPPENNDSFDFSNTFDFIKCITGKKPKDLTEFKLMDDSLLKNIAPKAKLFLNDLFTFEKTKKELLNEKVDFINETMEFEYFVEIKNFLTRYSKDEIMNFKYTISPAIRILLLNYDVPLIIANQNWCDSKISNRNKGEFVFVFNKPYEGYIKYNKLTGYDMLLYYLSYETLSGNDMVKILLEDEVLKDKPLAELIDEIYLFITNNLFYTAYIKTQDTTNI